MAGIGSELLLVHTFLEDFMPFLVLVRSDEPRAQFAGSKAPRGNMTEIAHIASRIGEQGSDVRTISKPMGLFGPNY